MSDVVDYEMAKAAKALWPAANRVTAVSGGLFNRVAKVECETGTYYIKRFTDAASSGNFPPLPTDSQQRRLVACSWHQHAELVSRERDCVTVPALLAVQTDSDLVAMSSVPGSPMHELLLARQLGAQAYLKPLIAWLAAFHTTPLEPQQKLLSASAAFKKFKVDLQYTQLLPHIPAATRRSAEGFTRAYLDTDLEPVHGDLNSRNVLVGDGMISVIDFEQGHFGEGTYDLAYIVSEFVIQALLCAMDTEPMICGVWESYEDSRQYGLSNDAECRFRVHLAFQTLYRLVGPSRKIWTGHLDDECRQRVIDWSVSELERRL